MTKTKTESIYDIKRKLNAMSHQTQTGKSVPHLLKNKISKEVLFHHDDAVSSAQVMLDALVRTGAKHASLVVTYDNGQQVVIKSSNQAGGFFDRLESSCRPT